MKYLAAIFCGLLALAATDAGARDGDLDSGFGLFGHDRVATASGSSLQPNGASLALQADNKLVLGGTRYQTVGGINNYDFSIVRLLPNGIQDSSFGVSGETAIAFNRPNSLNEDSLGALALQSDGRILAAGRVSGDMSTGDDMAVVRLLGNGTLDTAFGNGGKTVVAFNLGGSLDDGAFGIAEDSQHRVLIAGYAATTTGEAAAIVRLSADGTRDGSFSGDGRMTIPGPGGALSSAGHVRELASHKLLMVGFALTNAATSNYDFMVARINDDGTLDNTFGNGGIAYYGFDLGGDLQDAATDFVELVDGSLLVAGVARANAPANSDFALLKLTPDGHPDPGFAPRVFSFDLGGDQYDAATSIMIDSGGRILLAGLATVAPGVRDFAVIRLTAAGVLDNTFANNGRFRSGSQILFQTDYDNMGTAMVLDAQDHIVLAGSSRNDPNDTNKASYGAVRLMGDGIFSDGFGG